MIYLEVLNRKLPAACVRDVGDIFSNDATLLQCFRNVKDLPAGLLPIREWRLAEVLVLQFDLLMAAGPKLTFRRVVELPEELGEFLNALQCSGIRETEDLQLRALQAMLTKIIAFYKAECDVLQRERSKAVRMIRERHERWLQRPAANSHAAIAI